MPLVDITYTSGSGTPFISVGEDAEIYVAADDTFYFGPVQVITGTATAGTLRINFSTLPDSLSKLTAQTIYRPLGGTWAATTVTATEIGSTGTLAVTLDSSTLAASGTTTITGTLAVTLADSTLAASGDAGSGGSTGTLAVTLDSSTLAAAGDTTVTGTLAVTLDASTLAAAGDAGVLPQDDHNPGGGSRTFVGLPVKPRRRKIDEELEAILASLLLLT